MVKTKSIISSLKGQKSSTILIVDDSEFNRQVLSKIMTALGHHPVLAEDGLIALNMITKKLPDLILLDILMPRVDGFQVLKRMKADGILDKVPVIIISSVSNMEKIVECISLGAMDYFVKPIEPTLLIARVQSCIERKTSLDTEKQYRTLVEKYNSILETQIDEQTQEIAESHHSIIFALSKLAESRDEDTGSHLERIQEYSRVLCNQLRAKDKYTSILTDTYIEHIYYASPLHDIGKVSIPDAVLQKPGRLTNEEMSIMKQHTLLGANTLREVLNKHPNNEFIKRGIDIAENHHERWDGSGYPFQRAGEKIPLAGRIIALADVYDALTSKRCYKDAFSHEKSREIILDGRKTHFDPAIVDAFFLAEEDFKEIRSQYQDVE